MITSKIMRDSELDFAGLKSNPQRYADAVSGVFTDVEIVDGGDGADLVGLGSIGTEDRSLVAAAVASSSEGAVTLLSSDDELIASVREATLIDEKTYAFVWSESSIDFFGRLHECGALPFDLLLLVVEAEEAHLAERVIGGQISPERAESKRLALDKVVAAAALLEAKRGSNG